MRDSATTALLALWNDVDPAHDAQYNDWHAVEHVPERLTVPGIRWARRYGRAAGQGMPRYLTLYGLDDAGVLESAAYRRLLDHPTPASRAMRPRLSHVSRWVCKLHEQGELDSATHLAVQVFAGDASPGGHGRLLAERLPQARPLPWLQATQDQGIEGRWLVCMPVESDARTEGIVIYARLPVGLP